MSEINKVSKERVVEVKEILGYLVHRMLYHTDKKAASVVKERLEEGKTDNTNEVNEDQALWMITHGRGTGKSHYR